MATYLRIRLSVMMFIQYFIMGATVPILSHYLKNYLGLDPIQIGIILATPCVAGLVAPYLSAQIADRFISAERFLALCHFLAAGCMFFLSKQTTYHGFLILYFFYGFTFLPTLGLTNAVGFHHIGVRRQGFGTIRLWGTAGWVAVAWLFSYCWLQGATGQNSRLPDALMLSAIASCIMGCYAFTLPRSNIKKDPITTFTYWKAIKIFARPSMLLLCGLNLIASITHQFYYYGIGPFLYQAGYAERNIMPLMSIGQTMEVAMLGVLGICLAKLGIKRVLFIGIASHGLRYLCLASGTAPFLVFLAIGLHGLCFAFYFAAAYIYIDEHSTPQTRAATQQLYTMMTFGLGNLLGYLLAGQVGQWSTRAGAINYHWFWMFPALLAIIASIVIALFFKEEKPIEE